MDTFAPSICRMVHYIMISI